MDEALINVIREVVRQELRARPHAEIGLVDAVYELPDGGGDESYGCDVRLRDSSALLRRVPVATTAIGAAALPNEGDPVLVEFAGVDFGQPVVIGRLYTDRRRPPPYAKDQIVLRSPGLESDDAKAIRALIGRESEERSRVISAHIAGEVSAEMDHESVVVRCGETSLALSCGEGGGATIELSGCVLKMSDDGAVSVESDGDVTIAAGGALNLEARGAITINGQAGVAIDGAASAELSGGSVRIKGLTQFSM